MHPSAQPGETDLIAIIAVSHSKLSVCIATDPKKLGT